MILVELVPRLLETLITESQQITEQYPAITGINIPDVLRIPVRSYDGASALLQHNINAIPHIRTGDRDIAGHLNILIPLVDQGLKSVLIVTGDHDETGIHREISTLDLIAAIKSSLPVLQVFAGLDPYRNSLKNELLYCKQKLDAGAEGFFTQPFFDLKYAEVYLDQLTDCPIFLGVSPVTTEKSQTYWINQNNACFPPSFTLDLQGNCRLADKMIQLSQSYGQNIYLMPIKVDPLTYLEGIWQNSTAITV